MRPRRAAPRGDHPVDPGKVGPRLRAREARGAHEQRHGGRLAHTDLQRQERDAELLALSGDKRDVAFGNQIRTYTLQPYQLVKDERTRFESGNVQAVLDGDVDAFIESYLQWRRQRAE